ncbi:DUF2637 domain-containing protein [Actinoplanes sp. NPDC048988]|uniref:DUF2637 domain-containing protein n=1 Tax=Actinoplanes sp. NPDC048988 TaxID=3363901 RepID=UPI003721A53B
MRDIDWVKVAARGSAVVVALVAGASSFRHIAAVSLHYGEVAAVAYSLPFAIDGLLIVATMAMIEDKRAGRRIRWSARVAFVFGVVASLGANIASAQPSAGARIVAAVPAVALLLAIEVLSRSGAPADQVTGVTTIPASKSAPVAEQPADQPEPADVPVNEPRNVINIDRPTRTVKRRPAAETRRLIAELEDSFPGITRAEVAKRLDLSERRIRAVMAGVAA